MGKQTNATLKTTQNTNNKINQQHTPPQQTQNKTTKQSKQTNEKQNKTKH